MKCAVVACVLIHLMIVDVIRAESISCKDEQGNYVDWFYAYKLPKQYPPTSGDIAGLDFIVLRPGGRPWSRSPQNVESKDSMIGRTMSQAFTAEDHPNMAVVAFNDHPPFRYADSLNGHTKGLLVADDQSGAWIVHSVPMFPNITENPDDYFYPSTGRTYGQSFLCISVNASEIDTIGLQLVYNEAVIYTFKVSENLREKYPNLVRAHNKEKITQPPFQIIGEIQSSNGTTFLSFSKNRYFAQELYEDWIAPTLQTDLYVQAWRRGVGMMPSNCTQTHNVWNVSQINMSAIDFLFKTTSDHSKWAVSADWDQVPWICVGDVNRANAQQRRGGGTVCQHSSAVGDAYRNVINEIDLCAY